MASVAPGANFVPGPPIWSRQMQRLLPARRRRWSGLTEGPRRGDPVVIDVEAAGRLRAARPLGAVCAHCRPRRSTTPLAWRSRARSCPSGPSASVAPSAHFRMKRQHRPEGLRARRAASVCGSGGPTYARHPRPRHNFRARGRISLRNCGSTHDRRDVQGLIA